MSFCLPPTFRPSTPQPPWVTSSQAQMSASASSGCAALSQEMSEGYQPLLTLPE